MTIDFPETLRIDNHTIIIVPRYCETDQAGGVAIAAIITIARIIYFLDFLNELSETRLVWFRQKMAIGVWKAIPKTSIKVVTKETYSGNEKLEEAPRNFSLNLIKKPIVKGATTN